VRKSDAIRQVCGTVGLIRTLLHGGTSSAGRLVPWLVRHPSLPQNQRAPWDRDQLTLELYGLQEDLESLVELRRTLRRTRDLDPHVRPWHKDVQGAHNHLRLWVL